MASLIYVNSLLRGYEASQPEKRVEEAIEILARDAADGTIWNSISFPNVASGRFEEGIDLKAEYTSLITSGELQYSAEAGIHDEGELVYNVTSDGFVLARISLRAVGEPVTKLAVFSMQEWAIDTVTPILEEHEYTLSVPSDFTVKVNGVELTEADGVQSGGSGIDYKISGIYLKPDFHISDKAGNIAKYSFKGERVIPELYNYTLTLPSSLSVELNGEAHAGETLDDGRVKHDIRLLTKPTVKISDCYGNIVNYEGGDDLPLTYMTITATDKHTVEVAGASVPPAAVSDIVNSDYEHFSQYVEGLPTLKKYNIAILKDDIEITVTDETGAPVEFDSSVKTLDLTESEGLDTVPESVAAEINVLEIAENWSLLTSSDLSFYSIANNLIMSSYQYEVATKYANGIDITFMSIHTLLDPPFTNEKVGNFVWITDNCFSVDISFDKNMLLSDGNTLVDSMNHRFYFVKYDDPDNYYDTYSWKLVGMKKVVDDAEQ